MRDRDRIADLLRLARLRTDAAKADQQRARGALLRAQRATAAAIDHRDTLIANADAVQHNAIQRALASPARVTQIARIRLSYEIARDDIEAATADIELARDEENQRLATLKMKQSALAQCLRTEEKLGQIVRTQSEDHQRLGELLEELEAETAH